MDSTSHGAAAEDNEDNMNETWIDHGAIAIVAVAGVVSFLALVYLCMFCLVVRRTESKDMESVVRGMHDLLKSWLPWERMPRRRR